MTATCCLFILTITIVLNGCLEGVSSTMYEDLRCKCTCSSFKNVTAKIYKANVLHEDCNCLQVVVPNLQDNIIKEKDIDSYCYLCDCKYEVRSTKTMQVVVYIFLIVLGILVIYMVFMLVADPIINKMSEQSSQHQPLEEDQIEMTSSGRSDQSRVNPDHPHSTRSVFQRVNLVQSRWKKQVQEQRSSVFERQEILH